MTKKTMIVKNIRLMTQSEMNTEGWSGVRPTVLELDNGDILYASCDEEGNGPGCMFGTDKKGQGFIVRPT